MNVNKLERIIIYKACEELTRHRCVLVSCSSGIFLCRVSTTVLFPLWPGQLIGAVPSNLILNKLGKPSIYLPGCMVAWGVISCCTAATHNFAGLIVVRFLLGFVEAAYFVRIPLLAF